MSHSGSVNPYNQIPIAATQETLPPPEKRRRIDPPKENTAPLPTFPSGAVQNAAPSLSQKKVSLILDEYNRVCRNNGSLYSGPAKITYPDGSFYIDNFKGGIPKGPVAAFIYANGQQYFGGFQNRVPEGVGVLHYAAGGECKRYSGEFQDSLPHGFGEIDYVNGNKYSGELQNGKAHGYGEWSSPNGELYRGEFQNGRFHGHGIRLLISGCKYEGEFHNGYFQGRGKLTFPNGELAQGTFAHNILRKSDSSAIGTARFIIELFGLPGDGSWPGESLGTIADFLETNEEYKKYAEPLRAAHQRMQIEDLKEEAKKIRRALKENQEPQLLVYGTRKHAMGLNLVPREDYVICEIFNSGLELDKYHPFNGKKFQTMLQVKVPKTSLKKEVIYNLLNFHRSEKTTDEAYKTLLLLPGATRVSPNKPVWKSMQKGNNCGTKWIFYILDEMMGSKYPQMRQNICLTSIRQAQHNRDPITQQVLRDNAVLIDEKLNRKIERVHNNEKKVGIEKERPAF